MAFKYLAKDQRRRSHARSVALGHTSDRRVHGERQRGDREAIERIWAMVERDIDIDGSVRKIREYVR